MSFMNDVDVYKNMISEELSQKSCTIDYENSTEFMTLPKCEQIEETLVVGEEIVVDENMEINQQIPEDNTCDTKEAPVYFEQSLEQCTDVGIDYTESCPPTSMGVLSSIEENETETVSDETTSQEQEEDQDEMDEETIATFVTASGQQLALYAVEDLEEIFAVAVYDESCEPPKNFQFLMKADVERLIGEGAVRTVKKPTQMKKQLLTTQPPIFFSKEEMIQQIPVGNEQKIIVEEDQRRQKRCTWNKNTNLMEESHINMKENSNIIYTTANKQSDITYLMMDDCSVNIDEPESSQEEEEGEEDEEGEGGEVEGESDNEILEQSTVQYILFEGDQSDSELTFDEIQATLQNLKTSESKLSKKTSRKLTREQNNTNKMVVTTSNANHVNAITDVNSPEYAFETNHNSICNMSNYSSTLAERKLNFYETRQELLDVLKDSPTDSTTDSLKLHLPNGSLECPPSESTQTRFKAKRSRKQQLISVNRDDSEIIIQPASLLNEEDNNVRKRGKKKKRVVSHSGYHSKNNSSKRIKKVKHKEVEVIEIDVDEEDKALQNKRDVVEITIDDSKDKYSSDKENEVIMVRDSDDESQQPDTKLTSSLLECEHCSRNFRQQRALDTHLRVCSKSPANVLRLNEQKLKQASKTGEDTIKKQYPCKICHEKFDVVVALARHARAVHSQKKKPSVEQEPQEIFSTNSSKTQVKILRKARKKRGQRSSCTWDVKKLNCTDCGKWFPSTASLNAHCLQHGTKKTEQQIRRCQICKKLIKSRILFIKHLKMHSNAPQNTKSANNLLQKKLRSTRQAPCKIMTLRKRGRPRKL